MRILLLRLFLPSSFRILRFVLFCAAVALAVHQFDDAEDDEENRPRDVYKSPREDVDIGEEECRAEYDREDRHHFVMVAATGLARPMLFMLHVVVVHEMN
jgi:hypothetical protein